MSKRNHVANMTDEDLVDFASKSWQKREDEATVKAEFQLRHLKLAEQSKDAALRQAEAAEAQAKAAVKYSRYTFWLVVFTALVAIVTLAVGMLS